MSKSPITVGTQMPVKRKKKASVVKGYIALEIHQRLVTKPPVWFTLPEGCLGLMFAFRTKKSARVFCGKQIRLREFETEVPDE